MNHKYYSQGKYSAFGIESIKMIVRYFIIERGIINGNDNNIKALQFSQSKIEGRLCWK